MADILGICAGANMCTSLGALYYAVDITLVGSSLFLSLGLLFGSALSNSVSMVLVEPAVSPLGVSIGIFFVLELESYF